MKREAGSTRAAAAMTNADALLSVVIPCFNGEKYLAAAVESALNQRAAHVEVIVVDDGSRDGSRRIMDSFGSRIQVVHQANQGLPCARNAGIAVSRGEYVAFLDCDDYWAPDFAFKMIGALEGGDAAIAYCGWQNIGLPGPRGEPFVPPDYEASPKKIIQLIGGVRWPVHAAVVRRDVVEQTGGFDARWTSCEDFAFWIRAATSRRLIRVPEVLAYYRHHSAAQMTRDRAQIACNHWLVQMDYLRSNASVRASIEPETIRRITDGALLERGYESYWERDLAAAQKIFRRVARTGYGSVTDWKYLLAAMLPLSAYSWIVRNVDRKRATVKSKG